MALYRNGRGKGKNNSSLDDGQTQTALRLMIQADAVFEFKNKAIHESAMVGLDALLAAQFPAEAFPRSGQALSRSTSQFKQLPQARLPR